MTLADCSDEENRKAFEALESLKIMTSLAETSIRVPVCASGGLDVPLRQRTDQSLDNGELLHIGQGL